MFGLIGTLIIGGLAGYVGSVLFKGEGSGILINILLGIAGGFVGGWLFRLVGFTTTSIIGEFICAAVGAVVLLWIYQKIRS